MYLLTQLDEADWEKAIESWKGKSSVSPGDGVRPRASLRNVSYKESSDSESPSERSSSSGSEDESSESSDDVDDGDDDDTIPSTDEGEVLGASGTAFTIAETRTLAKHMASIPGWFKGQREWDSFCSKVSLDVHIFAV